MITVTEFNVSTKLQSIISNTEGVSASTLAKEIGMTLNNLNKTLNNDSLKLTDYIKICSALDLDPGDFLNENIQVSR